MFRRSRPLVPEEPTAFGWKISQLEAFAAGLAGDYPLIQTSITGILHSFSLNGESYRSAVTSARTERDTYRSMPLLFDEPPAVEDSCQLVAHEYELAGTMSWPPAIVQGSMAAAGRTSEISSNGKIGWLSITSEKKGLKRAVQPKLIYHFHFLNSVDLIEASNSVQTCLSGHGKAWVNFMVNSISDKEEWISKFQKDGVSPTLEIIKVYLSTSAGRMLDDW